MTLARLRAHGVEMVVIRTEKNVTELDPWRGPDAPLGGTGPLQITSAGVNGVEDLISRAKKDLFVVDAGLGCNSSIRRVFPDKVTGLSIERI